MQTAAIRAVIEVFRAILIGYHPPVGITVRRRVRMTCFAAPTREKFRVRCTSLKGAFVTLLEFDHFLTSFRLGLRGRDGFSIFSGGHPLNER